MPTDTLTDAKCRGAKLGPKPQKLFDGGGLHLFVSSTGAKTWRVAYRLAGKPQTLSLGPYPDVTLAQARGQRDGLKATLRDAGDPKASRRAKRATLTLQQAGETHWSGRRDLSPSYLANAHRALERHIYPRLGSAPIASIDRDQLLAVLDTMDAAGRHTFVRKTRMWVGQVFEWAVERGEAKINPAAQINPPQRIWPVQRRAFCGA